MVARKVVQTESIQQNLQNKPVGREETFLQTFLINHVEYFLTISVNLCGKVPVIDDALSSHEQEICPTNSLDENCMKLDFQTDWNYEVDLRQMYLALNLKYVKGRGYENHKSKEFKIEHKEEAEANAEAEQEEKRLQFYSILM